MLWIALACALAAGTIGLTSIAGAAGTVRWWRGRPEIALVIACGTPAVLAMVAFVVAWFRPGLSGAFTLLTVVCAVALV